MSEMVERVAKQLHRHRNGTPEEQARAVIKAMRNPTRAMVKASTWYPYLAAQTKECWQSLIDEALK